MPTKDNAPAPLLSDEGLHNIVLKHWTKEDRMIACAHVASEVQREYEEDRRALLAQNSELLDALESIADTADRCPYVVWIDLSDKIEEAKSILSKYRNPAHSR